MSKRTYEQGLGRIEEITDNVPENGIEWGIFAILATIASILLDIREKIADMGNK